ncbi:MAG: helix-turn-helix domain-containing protein [Paludibacteraceae bacterium]
MENPFEIILQRLDRIETLLLKLNESANQPKTDESEDEIMTVDQLSVYLTIAKATIYGKCSAREIPYFKVGKRVYFKKSVINEWLSQGRIHTMDEIKQQAEDYLVQRRRKR